MPGKVRQHVGARTSSIRKGTWRRSMPLLLPQGKSATPIGLPLGLEEEIDANFSIEESM
jgi:hypothetical protein